MHLKYLFYLCNFLAWLSNKQMSIIHLSILPAIHPSIHPPILPSHPSTYSSNNLNVQTSIQLYTRPSKLPLKLNIMVDETWAFSFWKQNIYNDFALVFYKCLQNLNIKTR